MNVCSMYLRDPLKVIYRYCTSNHSSATEGKVYDIDTVIHMRVQIRNEQM
jgi:hypothetical protein